MGSSHPTSSGWSAVNTEYHSRLSDVKSKTIALLERWSFLSRGTHYESVFYLSTGRDHDHPGISIALDVAYRPLDRREIQERIGTSQPITGILSMKTVYRG
jgi:hypothetical protein